MRAPGAEMGLLVEALRAVMRVELGLASSIVPVSDPDGGRRLTGPLLLAVRRHRIESVLAPHVDELGFEPELGAALRRAHQDSRLAAMALSVDTVHVSAILTNAGIPHLALKGVALAQQTGGDPFGRGTGDVDILVPPSWAASAVRVLTASGMWQDPATGPGPGSQHFARLLRVRKELRLWHGRRQVDLHWRLDAAPAALNWTFDELARSADVLTLGGWPVRHLGRVHSQILVATHGATDLWTQLRAFVDFLRFEPHLQSSTTYEEALRVGAARRWELASAISARLIGVPCRAPTRARVIADGLWGRVVAGEDFKGRPATSVSVAGLGLDLALYDSTRSAAQRAFSLAWPVDAMARRELRALGDSWPWTYAAASPYFLLRRATEKPVRVR